MLFYNVGLFLISILYTRSIEGYYPVYIDSSNGSDSKGCGRASNPCRTFVFAWHEGRDKRSDLEFNFYPGSYFSESLVDVHCTQKTSNIILKGIDSSSRPITFSTNLLVASCILHFENLEINYSHGQLEYYFYFSIISFKNITFIHSKVNIFSEASTINIDKSSMYNCSSGFSSFPIFKMSSLSEMETDVIVTDSRFRNTTGMLFKLNNMRRFFMKDTILSSNLVLMNTSASTNYTQELFGLSLTDISEISLQSVTLKHNQNFSMLVNRCILATVKNFTVQKNVLSHGLPLLRLHAGNVSLLNSNLIENKIRKANSLISIMEGSKFNCTGCTFQCNIINSNKFKTPMHYEVNVKDITIVRSNTVVCPVICQPGKYLVNNLLCVPCLKGTYSVSSLNKTSSKCTKCSPGTYASLDGARTCIKCPKGKFCDYSGCVTCKPCRNDFFTALDSGTKCSKPTILFLVLVAFTGALILIPGILMAVKQSKGQLWLSSNTVKLCQVYQEDRQTLVIN